MTGKNRQRSTHSAVCTPARSVESRLSAICDTEVTVESAAAKRTWTGSANWVHIVYTVLYGVYMREVGVRELRSDLSNCLQAVDQGEVIKINHHGHTRAYMIPATGNHWAALVASNEVTPARIKPCDILAQPPRAYTATAAAAGQADQ